MSFILSEQLKTRFNHIIDPEDQSFNPLYIVSTLLDPNFSFSLDATLIDNLSDWLYEMVFFKF